MFKKISILFCVIVLFLAYKPASAQTGTGLTISPPISEIELSPDKVFDQTIKINNPTKELVKVYPVARNFTAQGETGVPAIETPGEDATYGLASWISFSQNEISLTSEQEIEFKYKITVPEDAEPGGHYGAVLFASQPPKPDEKSTQVALASMVGSLILGKVPGKIVEQAEIKEFSTNGKIFLKPPVNFTLRITDSGNVHIKPNGEITISNWGKKVANLDVNPNKGNILPSQTRKFDGLKFEGKWYSFGRFQANLNTTYGAENTPLTANLSFWIIPWWLIALIILIIAIIVFLILRSKKRNKNNRIQAKKKVVLQ